MNGGEALAPQSRVCSYSAAGTDTSPIFLFNKTAIEQTTAPVPLTDYGPDVDLKDRVESCISMEPTYNTVVARTEMAKQIYEISDQQVRVCEKLVHDQHLQHQGWRAVVANLEDTTTALSASWNHLEHRFNQFFEQKSSNQHLLQNFRSDLITLSRIPLLPELGGAAGASLFDWINQKDHQKDLEQVADTCLQAVSRFEPSLLDELRQETGNLLSRSGSSDMKEIKGLEERLYGLDKLMAEARKLCAEEGDLSSALCKNQQRLANIRDPSIIPDLCNSHRTQLLVMGKNHQQLRDIRRRCVQAKKELSANLHLRLGWILSVYKQLAELFDKILVHRENIRRLHGHMQLVQQVHLAPKLYASAVTETVRRRHFSKQFLDFAAVISSDSSAIFNRETQMRQEFASALNDHFLSTLFPGFVDSIPSFAIESPAAFDTSLPLLDESHVQLLRQVTPELFPVTRSDAQTPGHAAILVKYLSNQTTPESNKKDVQCDTEDMTTQTTSLFTRLESFKTVVANAIQIMRLQNKDCGSVLSDFKTELGNVTQKVESEVVNLIAQMEGVHHKELERMQLHVSDVMRQNDELEKRSEQMHVKISELEADSAAHLLLKEKWTKLQEENESKRRIILEHEVDMVTTKEENERLESQVDELKSVITQLNSSLAAQDVELKLEKVKLTEENKLLKNEVDKLKLEVDKVKRNAEKEVKKHQEKWEVEKNRELKTQRDKLKAEHKLELENLRIRFRLSSSVERAQDSLTVEPAFDREPLLEQLSALKQQLANNEEKHAIELLSLKQNHGEEIEAAKQVAFSINISRLTEEKDKEIHQLKSQVTTLKSEIRNMTGHVSPVPWSSPAYNALDPDTKVSRLESLIREKNTRIAKLQESLNTTEKAAIIK